MNSSSTAGAGNSKSYAVLKRVVDTLDSSFITKRMKTADNTDRFDIQKQKLELLEAKNNMQTLKNKLVRLEHELQETKIINDAKVQKYEKRNFWDTTQIKDLTDALNKVHDRETKLQREYTALENLYEVLRSKSDLNIEKYENQICNMKADFTIERSYNNQEIERHKQKLTELQNLVTLFKENEISQKSYTKELEKQLTEKNEVARQLEMKSVQLCNANLELKAFQYFKENYDVCQQQIKTHEKKLFGYDALEKENQRLKEDVKRLRELIKGKLLLEEQVNDLSTRLKRFKAQQAEFESLKAKQTRSSLHLKEWHLIAYSICDSKEPYARLPHLLKSAIEALQNKEINLTVEKVQLQSNLNSVTHEFKLNTADLDKTRQQLAECKKSFDDSQNLIHILQSKVNILTAERDCYKDQLELQDREVATSRGMIMITDSQKVDKELIRKLNTLVEEYRSILGRLESDLKKVEKPIALNVLNNKIILLQGEVNSLKIQNEHLKKRKDALEVHLESIASFHTATDSTQREEALLKQIKEIRQHLKTTNREFEDLKVHCNELKETVNQQKELDNKPNHLKECCKTSLEDLKNIIYILFGYKLELENNDQYILTSRFSADEDEDQLRFQFDNGVMNLLETPYSLSLDNLIDYHLREQKSIPMFLSTITTELFNTALQDAKEDDGSSTSTLVSESSKRSIGDNSDKSSECSEKRSKSAKSKASELGGGSADED